METEDKIVRLLTMMEQPERMDEAELQALLADDECREIYETMVRTHDAYADGTETSGNVTGAEVEAALQAFEAAHQVRPIRRWTKVAAVVAAIVMVTGLSFAAYHFSRTTPQPSAPKTTAVTRDTTATPVVRHAEQTDTVVTGTKSFDDVTLQALIDEIAAYYHVEVEYAPTAVRTLRLHFRWDRAQSVEEVVETLNHFEHVDLMLDGNKLVVR